MTTHAAAYETIAARHPGAAGNRNDTEFAELISVIAFSGDDAYLLPYPLVPPSGYSVVPIAEATFFESGATVVYTKAFRDFTDLIQDGAWIDNTVAFLQAGTGFISAINTGRLGPRIRMIFNGAVHPAAIDGLRGQIHYAYTGNTYMGLQHFCEFEEHPPDSDTDPDSRLVELLNAFNQSSNSFSLGVDGSGNAIVANYCGFAGLAPEGAIFIRPEDIGLGPDQIAPDAVDNVVSNFRAHPSVFYPPGKAGFVRGVFRQAVDSIAINSVVPQASGGPIGITQVDAAPTTSNWLISVDGQFMIVQLNHPGGSDFRRPRDIWNNVWVPILTGGKSVSDATLFGGVIVTGGGIGFRWDYADYFRCLPLPGTNVFQDIPG